MRNDTASIRHATVTDGMGLFGYAQYTTSIGCDCHDCHYLNSLPVAKLTKYAFIYPAVFTELATFVKPNSKPLHLGFITLHDNCSFNYVHVLPQIQRFIVSKIISGFNNILNM